MGGSSDAQLVLCNETSNDESNPSTKTRRLLVHGLMIVAAVVGLHQFGTLLVESGKAGSSNGSSRALSEVIFFRSSNKDKVKQSPVFHFKELLRLGKDFTQFGRTLWGTAGYCYFGKSLSLSDEGKILVAGSPDARDGGVQAGKVTVYEQSGSSYKELGEYKGGSGEKLGSSVAVSTDGDWFIAGAPLSSAKEGKAGKAQLYEVTGGKAVLKETLFGALQNEQFGFSVAMNEDGERFAVGCPCFNTKYKKGSIITYENKNDKVKEILRPIEGNNNEKIGQAIALSSKKGDVLAVGNPEKNSVTVYAEYKGNWVERGDTITDDPGKNNRFGLSVSLNEDGTVVAIGSSTGTYVKVYEYDKDDYKWKKYGKTIDLKDTRFGYSVSLDKKGKTIVIGEPYDDTNEGWARVYKFKGSNKKWDKEGSKILGDDKGNMFGSAVSMSKDGKYIAISSPDAKDPKTGASYCGNVKVYKN